MNSFTENIYYQKTKQLRHQKYFYLFIIFLVLYIGQLVFIYLLFIPRILNNYENFPHIQELIRPALGLLDSFSFFWPIMFLSFLGSMIFYIRNTQKMMESIDNYQKPNRALSMNSITEYIYYQRTKKIGPRFFIFVFLLLLILYISVFISAYTLTIPKILNVYESSQTLYEHIRITLKMKVNLSVFWAIMLFSIIGIMIHHVKNTQKLINSIDN